MTPDELCTKNDLQPIIYQLSQLIERVEQIGLNKLLEFDKPMTRKEVAEHLGVEIQTVDNLSNDGILQKYRLGNSRFIRYKRHEIIAAMEPVKNMKHKHRNK